MKKIYSGIYQKEKKPSQQTNSFIMDLSQEKADNEILPYYLWDSLAHNLMLFKLGLVPKVTSKKILKALLELMVKQEAGKLVIDASIGDVHENMEAWLTEMIGKEAGWFHLARSRNDQVVCDQKLLTKALFYKMADKLVKLADVLAGKTEQGKYALMPGFTHMRAAMPSSFGFWCQSFLDQVIEQEEIIKSVYQTVDKCPLGSGSSYGVNWPIVPSQTSKNLGFKKSFNNALAAINNRGIHEIYWLGSLTVLMTILSRMMEDVMVFSMPELGYLKIDTEHTTGSSIMPQKINPDVAEKVRGKVGLVLGNLVASTVVIKGTLSGYNRDSAETKILLVNSFKEVIGVLEMVEQMIGKITLNQEKMKQAVLATMATRLADNLVKDNGLPFRQAHQVVGKALALADKDVKKVDPKLLKKLNLKSVLSDYSHVGSPSPVEVSKVNKKLIQANKQFKNWLASEQDKFNQAKLNLVNEVKELA